MIVLRLPNTVSPSFIKVLIHTFAAGIKTEISHFESFLSFSQKFYNLSSPSNTTSAQVTFKSGFRDLSILLSGLDKLFAFALVSQNSKLLQSSQSSSSINLWDKSTPQRDLSGKPLTSVYAGEPQSGIKYFTDYVSTALFGESASGSISETSCRDCFIETIPGILRLYYKIFKSISDYKRHTKPEWQSASNFSLSKSRSDFVNDKSRERSMDKRTSLVSLNPPYNDFKQDHSLLLVCNEIFGCMQRNMTSINFRLEYHLIENIICLWFSLNSDVLAKLAVDDNSLDLGIDNSCLDFVHTVVDITPVVIIHKVIDLVKSNLNATSSKELGRPFKGNNT